MGPSTIVVYVDQKISRGGCPVAWGEGMAQRETIKNKGENKSKNNRKREQEKQEIGRVGDEE